jgi:hypothetical protein
VSLCLVLRLHTCYAECHYAECCYAECCQAECHYAECRSAIKITSSSTYSRVSPEWLSQYNRLLPVCPLEDVAVRAGHEV